MNILLCTDNNYAMPTGVLMLSICNYNRNVRFFLLVDSSFSNDNRKKLLRIALDNECELNFYTISSELTSEMPVRRNDQKDYITKSAYNRLFVTSVLPKEIDKIIYLDSDIVVRKSLRSLWETDIEGFAVGVVNDMDEMKHLEYGRLPYDVKDGYFNSGVLLINVKFWRENNCLNNFFEIVEKKQELLAQHDQDVLNIAFHNKKKWLPITYNFQNGFIYKHQKLWNEEVIGKELKVAKHDPIVVHFAAWDKPWRLECFHPYCKDWRKYFFRSAWKNERLLGEEEHPTLKRRIRNWLVRHCIYVPASYYEKL